MLIDMMALAKAGAEARLNELRAEIADIEDAFPDLRGETSRQVEIRRERPSDSAGPATTRKRKRRAMSAAQRKAVGERMKKYWAERRKQAAAKK